MSRLDHEHDVIALAKDLGLQGSPVEAVLRYCEEKIHHWTADVGLPAAIDDLESLVAKELQLVFEEFRTDEELTEAIRKYTSQGEHAFAAVRTYFDSATFGTLVERRNVDGNAPDRYVAFIDCRGEKAARRFFTRWHEIAHLLTLTRQVELPVHRSAHEPLERLMDEIAGHIGFFEPLFNPVAARHSSNRIMTFSIVDFIRQDYCSEASFQATLFACQRRLSTPAIYLEAEMGYKVEEKRRIQSTQKSLFEVEKPEAKLRVSMIVPNKPAIQRKLQIAPNMRVPESSVIHRVFSYADAAGETAMENLNTWETKQAGFLPACELQVEARRTGNRVIALVQPLQQTLPTLTA